MIDVAGIAWSGMPAAILPDMIGLMRYTAILFAVLVFALVLAAAGDGACAECIHGCCARTDGPRRLLSSVRKMLRVITGRIATLIRLVASPVADVISSSIPLMLSRGKVAPLRI